MTLLTRLIFLQALLLCFNCLGLSFSLENKDSIKTYADNPLVVSYDSAFMSNYLYVEALFDTPNSNETESLPSFSDSIFAARIEALNKNTPLDLVFNPYVKQYINVYTTRRRDQLSRMMGLGAYYFPLFEEVLDQFDLPIELKYLTIVESALNPKAKSWAGATGLWQFMYATGKEYDLKVSSYVDERMDPYKSTVAACKFFEKSYAVYRDWSLVLASYNSGRGNVNKAIRRAGGEKNYWRIRRFLPKETRSYVPAFIAVCYAMNYASEHKIYMTKPSLSDGPTDTLRVHYQINLDYVSTTLNIPLAELEFLNPAYKINIIPNIEGRNYYLRLPQDKTGVFVANEEEIYSHFIRLDQEKSNKYPKYSEQDERIIYRVKSGEYLGKIAKRYGCSVKKIQQWNNLKNDGIQVGQKLILYVRPDFV
tara:strand:- start:4707 stop:5972 length:1266 start_codon:yes stop_codon:yes gene_type:complete